MKLEEKVQKFNENMQNFKTRSFSVSQNNSKHFFVFFLFFLFFLFPETRYSAKQLPDSYSFVEAKGKVVASVGGLKQPQKVTSHPPTAIRIMFKEYKMEIHRPELKFYTQTLCLILLLVHNFLTMLLRVHMR